VASISATLPAGQEADGRVGGHPAGGDGQVQGEQVAVGQTVVERASVQHRVVHRGADVVAERTAAERRRIVDVTRLGTRVDDEILCPGVDLEQIGTDRDPVAERPEDVGDQRAGHPRTGQLGGVQDLDHRVPSSASG
jgi:hypothetical protein